MRRGFTLVEAMVTMAIAGIVTTAAAGAMAMIMRSVQNTRIGVTVTSNLVNTVQFLSKDIENAGGQGLPTQAGIMVENDTCPARDGMPACNGTDRVTIATAMPELPVCATRAGSRPNALSFQYVQGGCCFPSNIGGNAVTGVAMLTGPNQIFRPVQVTGIANAVCEFTVADAVPNSLYLNSPIVSDHASFAGDDFTPFVDGTATLVLLRTYYLDTATHELRVRHGVGASAQTALVADQIFDLQVALGVDVDDDGRVAENEWAFRGGLGVATSPFQTRLLPPREVMVSVVQGVPASLRPDAVESPLRAAGADRVVTNPGTALRAGVAHVSPVNALLRVAP
jgi:prepilin-type N-terminal cleavage/methylation domain-containing protein